jgi:hypothetical protein
MMTLIPDWRQQVSQDAEVTKGGLRVAWFLMEHPGFAQVGCMLDDVVIGTATRMHPHSVANSVTILRGLGHIACRKIMVDDKRLRLIRPSFHGAERDVATSNLDTLKPPIEPPSPTPPVPDRIVAELPSPEQPAASGSELRRDAVMHSVERVDPATAYRSAAVFETHEPIRRSRAPISTSWPSSSENEWERSLTGFKIPLRCQHVSCDRPTTYLCLEMQKSFCQRHLKHARVPAPLALSALLAL